MEPTNIDIAIVAPFKKWGGLERQFCLLSEDFLKLGFTVEIVSIRTGLAPDPCQLPEGVKVRVIESRSKRDGIPALVHYLREVQPKVVLTAQDHAAQTVLIARCFSGVSTRIFVTVTNVLSVVMKRKLQRLCARFLYRRADGVITITEALKQDCQRFLKLPENLMQPIFNPIVTEDFQSRCATAVDHPWFTQRLADTHLIVSAGRLEKQKDFETLIRAFAELAAVQPARLVIFGEGSKRPELEQLIEQLDLTGQVDLPGAVSDPVPYMHQSDVFAMSSLHEGFGNVLAEALAAGTRVVSTRYVSGADEILNAGLYGRLTPVGDASALAEAMAQSLDEPKRSMAQAQEASRPFEAKHVAKQYLQYMGLIDS